MAGWNKIAGLRDLLRETTPPPEQIALRLQTVERDIVLPVKAVFIGILLYYLYFYQWYEEVSLPRSVAQQTIEHFFLLYLVLNVIVAGVLLLSRPVPSPSLQGLIFTSSFVDGLFLASLTFVTGGFDSILYWLFLGLNVRNALSVPRAVPQLVLNISAVFCYLGAGVLDVAVEDELQSDGNTAEPFLLRIIVLWLVTLCCYGVQVLFERHRQAEEEAREYSARQAQLQSAGRLAAQIAHQLKNPLGIINNAAFSLQRALRDGGPADSRQVQIIREEVGRSDRILTRLMGYAQLAEGTVEKLDVVESIERALNQVFPPGGQFPVEIVRDYAAGLPRLLMQRGHLMEIFVNLFQNAREAFAGPGILRVTATHVEGREVRLVVEDNGPGMAPEQLGRIFNPYFSTKDKGTGLGLAIVKNDVEMYSGSVHVNSELGKGTRFEVRFPTRTFMTLRK